MAGYDGGKEHYDGDVSGDGATVLEGEWNRLLGDGVEEGEGFGVNGGIKRSAGGRLSRRLSLSITG